MSIDEPVPYEIPPAVIEMLDAIRGKHEPLPFPRDLYAAEITPIVAAEDAMIAMLDRLSDAPPVLLGELEHEQVTFSIAIRFAIYAADYDHLADMWIAIDNMEPERQLAVAAQLREVSRRVPGALRVGPLFLSAWAAWRRGDKRRAEVAIDVALQIKPNHYGGTALLRQMKIGTDPAALPLLDESMTKGA